jgi:hypothetical protein
MAFKISTGLRNFLLGSGDDLATAFNGDMLIKIYGDPTSAEAADALVPTSPNDSIGTATLLCTISNAGAGTSLNFEVTPVSGVLAKSSTEEWYGTNVASGYASFYRAASMSDTGASSTTAKRMQGTVDVLNCDLIVASKYLTISQEQRVDNFYVGMPESA